MTIFSSFMTILTTIVGTAAVFVASLVFGSTLFSLIVAIFVSIPTIATIVGTLLVLPLELADEAYRKENIRQINSYKP